MEGSYVTDYLGAESIDSLGFLESLKELKELRSQIHDAADYCEKSYLTSEQKTVVLENTREYLCRAVVTVVDHLGCVSANLDSFIQKSDRVNETNHRINCLNQKLDSCDQFNRNFTVTKTRWSVDLPRLYSRYILPPSSNPSEESSSNSREFNQPTAVVKVRGHEFKTVEDKPLFMYTSSNKICLGTSPRSPLEISATEITVLPVRNGVSVAPKLIRNPFFHFQGHRKPGGMRRFLQSVHRKSSSDEEILSIIPRSRSSPSRLLKFKQLLHLNFS